LITNQSVRVHSLRITPYIYQYWHPFDSIWLTGGAAFDYQSLPQNAQSAPLSSDQKVQQKLSPKAGLIWTPTARSTVRAAYSQSLGGADLDQSVRLEPTQVAGFVQAYRDLIPDSLAGSIGGAGYETFDFSLEHRFLTDTYVALAAEQLNSTASQVAGAYLHDDTSSGPSLQLGEDFKFKEDSIEASLHQLFGHRFSASLRYKLSDAQLKTSFTGLGAAQGQQNFNDRGLLQLVSLSGVFQHPGGFFASAETQWWNQELRDDLSSLHGDSFWQVNLMAGYRSPRRHFELSVGLLNVTDQNYALSPINVYPDLARERTFVTRLKINF
jgi:outer membrane receptor protein involved in Fe transport